GFLGFLSYYGLPGEGLWATEGTDEVPLTVIQAMQAHLCALLANQDRAIAIEMFNRVDGKLGTMSMNQQLDSGGRAVPMLRLRPLFHYMRAEAALIIANSARIQTCRHCNAPIPTGGGTRRSNIQYCSAKCRARAFHARQRVASVSRLLARSPS